MQLIATICFIIGGAIIGFNIGERIYKYQNRNKNDEPCESNAKQ